MGFAKSHDKRRRRRLFRERNAMPKGRFFNGDRRFDRIRRGGLLVSGMEADATLKLVNTLLRKPRV